MRLDAGGKKLGTKHLQVLPHHHNFSLHVQVIDRGHHETACCDAKGGVLDGLELFNATYTGIWEPDRRGVTEERVNECFLGGNCGLLLLGLVSSSEGLQGGESLFNFLFDSFPVFVEAEVRVERDTQDVRVSVQRQQGDIERDHRVYACPSCVGEVKSVTVDFCAETCSSFSAAHASTSWAWLPLGAVASLTSECEQTVDLVFVQHLFIQRVSVESFSSNPNLS